MYHLLLLLIEEEGGARLGWGEVMLNITHAAHEVHVHVVHRKHIKSLYAISYLEKHKRSQFT